MPKMKPHKGLLKRVRLSKTGLARHNKAGSKHLRSSKAPDRLRSLRAGGTMPNNQIRLASRLLGVRIRGKDQPATVIKRSPNPEESRELKKANRAAAQERLQAVLDARVITWGASNKTSTAPAAKKPAAPRPAAKSTAKSK